MERLKEEIIMIETSLYSPKAPKIDGMPRGGSGDSSDLIIKYLDLQRQFKKKIAKSIVILQEIDNAIDTLPTGERYVIRLRFVEGLTVRETAEECNYSERQVLRYQKEAIKKICH